MKTITLERITSLSQLKRPKGVNEYDYVLYEYFNKECLHEIFLQINWEAKRIYVDFLPDRPDVSEHHEWQEYHNFDESKDFFAKHSIYKIR